MEKHRILENMLQSIKKIILSLNKGNITIHWKGSSVKWEANLTEDEIEQLLGLDKHDKDSTI